MNNLSIEELKEMYANIFPTGMSKYSRAIAELIAIREREGDPVPYGYYSAETATILEQQGHANISAEPLADSRFPLFTAPQKPVGIRQIGYIDHDGGEFGEYFAELTDSAEIGQAVYVIDAAIEAAGCEVKNADS